jgi:hypothetical protein
VARIIAASDTPERGGEERNPEAPNTADDTPAKPRAAPLLPPPFAAVTVARLRFDGKKGRAHFLGSTSAAKLGGIGSLAQ